AAVGDLLLVGQGHLRERAAVAVVGDEDGVVAEAFVAAGFRSDATLDGSLGDELAPVRKGHERDRAEPGPTVLGAVQLADELADVVGVGGVRPGEPRGVHTGTTV